jgi:SAM-dependent methyltransferase
VDRFDLIVSWHALEHVRHMNRVAGALHRHLRAGGWFVAGLSGRNAAFAVANRLLPSAIGARFVALLRRRPRESVFPAHYDRCTATGLRNAFADWDQVEVVPIWHGADYFDRTPRMQALYLYYENWAAARSFNDLGTHYVIAARKGGA